MHFSCCDSRVTYPTQLMALYWIIRIQFGLRYACRLGHSISCKWVGSQSSGLDLLHIIHIRGILASNLGSNQLYDWWIWFLFFFCSVMLHCYHMVSSHRFLSHTFQSVFRSGRNTQRYGLCIPKCLELPNNFCKIVFSCNHSSCLSEHT